MPVTFHEHTLANGLTIVAEVDPDAVSSGVGFFVRTGARDEATPVMGVSHFLEHMMFKGTESISADDLNRLFDELGAQNNAYTSHEMTCFYAQVLPEKLGEATDLVGQMMRPALRDDDFTTEKGVILEEIAMYKDNPFWVLYEACGERHYADHPMSHRVLGTEQTINDLTSEQMRAYFAERYAADNTTVALAGRLDFEAMCARIGSVCGGWAASGTKTARVAPGVGAPAFELHDERVNRVYMLALAPAPGIEDDRRYAAQLLAMLLGDPGNSRLHWALIEPGLAEEAQAAYDPHDGFGQFFVYASGEPERAGQIKAALDAEIASLADAIDDDGLERLRSKLATAVMLGGERPGDRMQRLGRQWTYRREYRTLDEELERINAVTVDDVRALLADFPFEPRTVGTLGP